jgi:glycosyl transferase, family 25
LIALVINLGTETVRMEFQSRQLAELGIIFTRLEAKTPHSLPAPPQDRYWSYWERPMRVAEMAAYASHRAAWQLVADGRSPVLVLEDDALLMPGAPAFLGQVETLSGIDHITLETRARRKLVSNTPHPQAPMRRLWQDRSGAAAYVLWPSGARKLLAHKPAIADAVICAAYDLGSFQADPALAIQIDQCAAHGLTPPIAVTSTILAGRKPALAGLPVGAQTRFRWRRFTAQLRMGARRLSRLVGSSRRHVSLAVPQGRR